MARLRIHSLGAMGGVCAPVPGAGAKDPGHPEGRAKSGLEPQWEGAVLREPDTESTLTAWSMNSVDVDVTRGVRVGAPRRLFELNPDDLAFYCLPMRCYDVAPDGQRFYVPKSVAPLPPAPVVTHINLIQNWFEELKAKVPAGGAK